MLLLYQSPEEPCTQIYSFPPHAPILFFETDRPLLWLSQTHRRPEVGTGVEKAHGDCPELSKDLCLHTEVQSAHSPSSTFGGKAQVQERKHKPLQTACRVFWAFWRGFFQTQNQFQSFPVFAGVSKKFGNHCCWELFLNHHHFPHRPVNYYLSRIKNPD